MALLGGLIKNKEERIEKKTEKGKDAIKMKDWNGALKYFNGLIDKGNATPDIYVLRQMVLMAMDYDSTKILNDSIDLFRKNKDLTVEYGAHTVKVSQLLYECELRRDDETLSSKEDSVEVGEAFIRLGQKYMDLEYPNLILNDVFKEEKMSPSMLGNYIQGEGYSTIAESIKYESPKMAAERMISARQFYTECNFEDDVKRCDEFIENASKSGKCWFCNREETGLFMRLWPMPTLLSKENYAKEGERMPDNDSNKNVYACSGCRFVFYNQYQDCLKESKQYTDGKVQDLADWTASRLDNLQSQINALDRRIDSLRR